MEFKLHYAHQAYNYFEELKESMYNGIDKASKKYPNIIRITGLPIALASASITLAERVSGVAEPIIKGLANLFGAPFSKKCNALIGLKQLFITTPIKVLQLVIVTPIYITIGTIVTTVMMVIKPERYPEARARDHYYEAKTKFNF